MSARSETRLLGVDPVSGVESYWHWDAASETYTIEDVDPNLDALIDLNKTLYNEELNQRGDMRRIASVPMTVYQDLVKQGITRDPKAFKQWLNDRDNLVFRTQPGRI
jgi:hypothetical protein